MSFVLGTVAGSLVAGGVYYGFSNLVQTRTAQHKKDLHTLAVRLRETPALLIAPPSAASRIEHKPFATLLKSRWNDQVQAIFMNVRDWDGRVVEFGKKLVYGSKDS